MGGALQDAWLGLDASGEGSAALQVQIQVGVHRGPVGVADVVDELERITFTRDNGIDLRRATALGEVIHVKFVVVARAILDILDEYIISPIVCPLVPHPEGMFAVQSRSQEATILGLGPRSDVLLVAMAFKATIYEYARRPSGSAIIREHTTGQAEESNELYDVTKPDF